MANPLAFLDRFAVRRRLDRFDKISFIAFALPVCAFFEYGAITSAYDYFRWDPTPKEVSVSGSIDISAKSSQWVSIAEKHAWDCEKTLDHVVGAHTAVVGRARDGSVVIANYQRAIECESEIAEPLEGVIEHASASEVSDLRANGVAITSDARVGILRMGKSRTSVREDIVVCVLGVVLWPFFLIGLILWKRGEFLALLNSWIHAPPDKQAAANIKLRVLGAALIAMGAVMLGTDFFEGWYLWGLVPVQKLAPVTFVIGPLYLFAPGFLRRRRSA